MRHLILSVLLLFCVPLYTQTQTTLSKKGPASSISGKITIKGKAAPGIVVGLRANAPDGQETLQYRGVTDQDGNYRITNVAPGTYQVIPAAPAFVIVGQNNPEGISLIITGSETIEGIDFALNRGGVITGRVTNSEGRPLIEEPIQLLPTESNNQQGAIYFVGGRNIQTDDRGIYRIFGLPAGRYKVALGQSEGGFFGGRRRSQYKQTFHPDVTDPAKAVIIEVTEGSEVANVDITVGRSLETFSVSGRIVDGDTGQPLPNVGIFLRRILSQGNPFGFPGSASNSLGQFTIENVTPGKYEVLIRPQEKSEVRADAVPFDLIDQDVTGLLVKTTAGASVSGMIVLERTDDKTLLAKLHQLQLSTHVQNESQGPNFPQSTSINQDGSFRVGGLPPGMANFSLFSPGRGPMREFRIMRVERDGVAQGRGVEVKNREQVTGIRIVVSYGNGTIRGVVKVENVELPSNARFSVWLTNPADDPTKSQRMFESSPQVDSRGRFLVESLPPGTYEVNASVYIPGSRSRPPTAKQQVNVADGIVTEVTITLDLNPDPAPGNP